MLGLALVKNVVIGYGAGSLAARFAPSPAAAVVLSAGAGFVLGGFSFVALITGTVTSAMLANEKEL